MQISRCPKCGDALGAYALTCARCGLDRPLDPTRVAALKRWLIVQLAGGLLAIVGILGTVYVMAGAAKAGVPLPLPMASALLAVGILVHVVGRIGVRRNL